MPEDYRDNTHARGDLEIEVATLKTIVGEMAQTMAANDARSRSDNMATRREFFEKDFVGGDLFSPGLVIPEPIPLPPTSGSGSSLTSSLGGGFELRHDGSNIRMNAGECEYYKSASDTWDAETIADRSIAVPSSGTTYVYIVRTINASDVPTNTYTTGAAYPTLDNDAAGDDDIYMIGYVNADGTFGNFNIGPWHEKRMA